MEWRKRRTLTCPPFAAPKHAASHISASSTDCKEAEGAHGEGARGTLFVQKDEGLQTALLRYIFDGERRQLKGGPHFWRCARGTDLDRRLQRLEVASHNCYIQNAELIPVHTGIVLADEPLVPCMVLEVEKGLVRNRSTAQMSTSVRPWYAA